MLDLKLTATDNEARVFAGCQLLLALLIAWWLDSREYRAIAVVLLITSLAITVIGLWRPRAIRWFYAGWMLAAFPIGWVMSYVVAGFVYFLVITPIGLVMRLIGRDGLARSFDPQAETYWEATPESAEPGSYFRQF